MQPCALITLGRLPKSLDLARSFKRLGYRVIVAEPFRWHLTRTSNVVSKCYQVVSPAINREQFLTALCDIVVNENVTMVVPISEEIIHVSFLRERLEKLEHRNVQLYAMPSETLLRLHHKYQFIDACREVGVAAPETVLLTDVKAAGALANQYDTIIKPIFSCSGRGVIFRKCSEPVPQDDKNSPAILQRWVHGNVLSTFSIAHEGRALTTVVYRGILMSGTVAVAFERVTEDDAQHHAVTAWVDKFIRATAFSGFISFDLVVDRDGNAHGIECNPRATSGLHFVDSRDLANAVVNPTTAHVIRFRDEKQLQQFYPALTEVQKSMFSANFWHNLATLWRAKDVTWSWRDPMPFITMPLTASQIIWLSIKRGTTFGEVATLDVGWYDAK
jgi:predicted ATP-grasp superfamily ATP-dependent carboligase